MERSFRRSPLPHARARARAHTHKHAGQVPERTHPRIMELAVDRSSPHSLGDTFWVASDAEPRCALEQIALGIFELHAAPAKATGVRTEEPALGHVSAAFTPALAVLVSVCARAWAHTQCVQAG